MDLDYIKFGHYELIRQIGRGGMAEIFLALDCGMKGVERQVAIKRILPQMSESDDFVTMFMDEARVAARLTHPNIAHIYNFGEVNGVYFLAMEFIEGLTCSKLIRLSKPATIPIEIILRVVADTCAALHYAHEMRENSGDLLNLVHRDVNPQNVMVSHNGIAKLLDFGVARASTQSHATKVGQVKGKLGYIAPEAFRGIPLDRRADIFSTGALLFEMIDGTKLFRREIEAATVAAILNDDPPRLAASRGVPAMIDNIIRRAVEKDRDERYSTAHAMQQDLEELIAKRGYVASPFIVGQFVTDMLEKVARQRREKEEKEGLDNVATIRAQQSSPPANRNAAVSTYHPAAPVSIPIDMEDGTTEISQPSAVSALDDAELSPAPESEISEGSEPSGVSQPSAVSEVSSPSFPDEVSESSNPSEPSIQSEPSALSARSYASEPSLGVDDPGFIHEEAAVDDAMHMVDLPEEQVPRDSDFAPPVVQPLLSAPSEPDLIDYPEAESFQSRGRVIAIIAIVAVLLVSGIIGLIMVLSPDDFVTSSGGDHTGGTKAGVGPLVEALAKAPDSPQTDDTTEPRTDGGLEDETKVAVSPDAAVKQPQPEGDSSIAPEAPSKVGKRVKVSPHVTRPPRKSTHAPPQPPGKLYLHTSPWSKVRIGGRSLGTTPIAGVSLPAGSHQLRLVDADGRTHSRRIRIRPGEPTKLFINMREVGR